MKKFAKLSLVAAVAVAGITTANAQDLSEAIKNVDVSGTIAYRYNDYETTEKKSDGSKNQNGVNNYKLAVNVNSKVNDDVTANTRFLAEKFEMDTGSHPDENIEVKLSEVNFLYSGVQNATLKVGKQAVDTAFTVARDSIGTEQVGTGIVGTYNIGPVNAFAGYFNQNNFNSTFEENAVASPMSFKGTEDIIIAGAAVAMANINLDASYMNVDTESNLATAGKFDAYTVGLSASYKVSDISLSSYARYSALEMDNAASSQDEHSLWKVGISAEMGVFGAYIAYGETDEEGGYVGIDLSSTTGFDEHWRVTLSGIKDASVVYAGTSAQVTDTVNVALKYSDLDADSTKDSQDEIYAQVLYTMSSNFYAYARLGVLDREELKDDVTIGRLHVQYSF